MQDSVDLFHAESQSREIQLFSFLRSTTWESWSPLFMFNQVLKLGPNEYIILKQLIISLNNNIFRVSGKNIIPFQAPPMLLLL